MDHLSESVRSEMSQTIRVQLEAVFNDMAAENEQNERAKKATMQSLLQDIVEMEAVLNAEREEWGKKKETLLKGIEVARREEQLKCQLEKDLNFYCINSEKEELEQEKEKCKKLEFENNTLQELLEKQDDDHDDAVAERLKEQMNKDLENFERMTTERVDLVLSGALVVAPLKHKLLTELKVQAEKEVNKSFCFAV